MSGEFMVVGLGLGAMVPVVYTSLDLDILNTYKVQPTAEYN